jgi:hypothetical protein
MSQESRFARHDLAVVVVALLALVIFAAIHRAMAAPPVAHLSRLGLTLTYPATFVGEPGGDTLPSLTTLSSVDEPGLGLAIKVDSKPIFDGPLDSALEFERAQAYGSMYQNLGHRHRNVLGHDWFRTEFAYAYKTTPADAPRVAWAVEYATVNGDRLYIVTLHGERDRVHDLEAGLVHGLVLK